MQLVRARLAIRTITGAVTVLALGPPGVQSEAQIAPGAASAERSDPPRTDAAKRALPPRALLRIGTDDLRAQDLHPVFAFSPDGRSVAVAGGVAASPRVVIFDVRTGQEVKQIVAPGNREGGVGSLALSPDGTKLLWGEYDGQVALWTCRATGSCSARGCAKTRSTRSHSLPMAA